MAALVAGFVSPPMPSSSFCQTHIYRYILLLFSMNSQAIQFFLLILRNSLDNRCFGKFHFLYFSQNFINYFSFSIITPVRNKSPAHDWVFIILESSYQRRSKWWARKFLIYNCNGNSSFLWTWRLDRCANSQSMCTRWSVELISHGGSCRSMWRAICHEESSRDKEMRKVRLCVIEESRNDARERKWRRIGSDRGEEMRGKREGSFCGVVTNYLIIHTKKLVVSIS